MEAVVMKIYTTSR